MSWFFILSVLLHMQTLNDPQLQLSLHDTILKEQQTQQQHCKICSKTVNNEALISMIYSYCCACWSHVTSQQLLSDEA